MSAHFADRNLLFGVLALQLDFVNVEQLLQAMNAWMRDKTKSLGDILVEQGVLELNVCDLLGGLVEHHVQHHANDVRKSLQSVRLELSVRTQLEQVSDRDVEESLSLLPANIQTVDESQAESLSEDNSQALYSIGQATSAGERFRVLRPHAEGGLGVISVALDTELNREVAFKEIKPNHAADVRSQGRFILEAEVTGGLEHPSIVPVYGFGRRSDGRPFYAMRFIRGQSFKDAIREFHERSGTQSATEQNLAFRELLDRFTDVCQAIEYAHNRGVLHRDIKPDNIMLGKYGETLVVDWGLAKTTGDKPSDPSASLAPLTPSGQSESAETVAGTAMGTPHYMPPEQAEGRLDLLSPQSDVYALGATLVTLVTGRQPVEGNGVDAVLKNVRSGNVVPRQLAPLGVPKSLWAVCDKAMATDPKQRYTSARKLAQEIERFLGDEPVLAARDPLPVRVRRWTRKHPGITAAGAMSGLLLLVFFAVGFGVVTRFNQYLEAANFAEREANSQLEAANRAEKKARRWAEENFTASKEAVEKYLVLVTESKRLKEADFTDLRKELLDSAKPFYEKLRDQKPGDEKVESSRAEAFLRLAHIQAETGELEQARNNYEECIAVYQRLASEFSDVPDSRSDLATTHNNLGAVLVDLGERAEARRHYEEALALQMQLVKDFPNAPDSRSDLAGTHNNLGLLLSDLGDRPAAQQHFQKALALRQQLAERYPNVSQYRSDLATGYSNLGVLLAGLGNRSGAQKQFEKALALRQQLADDFPSVPDSRSDLAATHNNLGILLVGLGNRPRGQKQYEQALALQQQLASEFPNVPRYHSELARSYTNLGNLFVGFGNRSGAQKQYEKALAIRQLLAGKYPDVPEYRSELAQSHNHLGALLRGLGMQSGVKQHYEKALALCQQLADDFPDVVAYKVDLGGSYCNTGSLLNLVDPTAALLMYEKAEVVLKTALDMDPRHATARRFLLNTHYWQAKSLDNLARFAEAAQAWREASALAVGRSKVVFQHNSAKSQTLAKNVKGFEQILSGNATPADANHRLALAEYCYLPGRKLYRAAADQYQHAFTEDPALVRAHRYNAACCAALTAVGQGNDAKDLTPEQQADWRNQALVWLQADLAIHAKNAASENAKLRASATQTLKHWLKDPDLKGVREKAALDKLPEDERKKWQAFWHTIRKAVP